MTNYINGMDEICRLKPSYLENEWYLDTLLLYLIAERSDYLLNLSNSNKGDYLYAKKNNIGI